MSDSSHSAINYNKDASATGNHMIKDQSTNKSKMDDDNVEDINAHQSKKDKVDKEVTSQEYLPPSPSESPPPDDDNEEDEYENVDKTNDEKIHSPAASPPADADGNSIPSPMSPPMSPPREESNDAVIDEPIDVEPKQNVENHVNEEANEKNPDGEDDIYDNSEDDKESPEISPPSSPYEKENPKIVLVSIEEKNHNEPKWEEEQFKNNQAAKLLQQMYVPEDIESVSSPKELLDRGIDNPKLAKRLLERQGLWLARINQDTLSKMDADEFCARFSTSGLDLIELRAAFASLPQKQFVNDPQGQKQEWRVNLKQKIVAFSERSKQALGSGEVFAPLYPEEARSQAYLKQGSMEWSNGPFDYDESRYVDDQSKEALQGYLEYAIMLHITRMEEGENVYGSEEKAKHEEENLVQSSQKANKNEFQEISEKDSLSPPPSPIPESNDEIQTSQQHKTLQKIVPPPPPSPSVASLLKEVNNSESNEEFMRAESSLLNEELPEEEQKDAVENKEEILVPPTKESVEIIEKKYEDENTQEVVAIEDENDASIEEPSTPSMGIDSNEQDDGLDGDFDSVPPPMSPEGSIIEPPETEENFEESFEPEDLPAKENQPTLNALIILDSEFQSDSTAVFSPQNEPETVQANEKRTIGNPEIAPAITSVFPAPTEFTLLTEITVIPEEVEHTSNQSPSYPLPSDDIVNSIMEQKGKNSTLNHQSQQHFQNVYEDSYQDDDFFPPPPPNYPPPIDDFGVRPPMPFESNVTTENEMASDEIRLYIIRFLRAVHSGRRMVKGYPVPIKDLRSSFDSIDQDKNGFVSAGEIIRLFLCMDPDLTNESAIKLTKTILAPLEEFIENISFIGFASSLEPYLDRLVSKPLPEPSVTENKNHSTTAAFHVSKHDIDKSKYQRNLNAYKHWINCLNIWQPIENLAKEFQSGVLLCRLVEHLQKQKDINFQLRGIDEKPRAPAPALKNIELALSLVWRQGASTKQMPSADKIYAGDRLAILGLLNEIFRLFVMCHVNSTQVLGWFNLVLEHYHKKLSIEVLTPPHPALWNAFGGGDSILCVLHFFCGPNGSQGLYGFHQESNLQFLPRYLPSVILENAFNNPVSKVEMEHNIKEIVVYLEKLGVLVPWTVEDFLLGQDQEMLLFQLSLIYKRFRESTSALPLVSLGAPLVSPIKNAAQGQHIMIDKFSEAKVVGIRWKNDPPKQTRQQTLQSARSIERVQSDSVPREKRQFARTVESEEPKFHGFHTFSSDESNFEGDLAPTYGSSITSKNTISKGKGQWYHHSSSRYSSAPSSELYGAEESIAVDQRLPTGSLHESEMRYRSDSLIRKVGREIMKEYDRDHGLIDNRKSAFEVHVMKQEAIMGDDDESENEEAIVSAIDWLSNEHVVLFHNRNRIERCLIWLRPADNAPKVLQSNDFDFVLEWASVSNTNDVGFVLLSEIITLEVIPSPQNQVIMLIHIQPTRQVVPGKKVQRASIKVQAEDSLVGLQFVSHLNHLIASKQLYRGFDENER